MPQTEIAVTDEAGDEWIVIKQSFEGRTDVSSDQGKATETPSPQYLLHDVRRNFRVEVSALPDEESFVDDAGKFTGLPDAIAFG